MVSRPRFTGCGGGGVAVTVMAMLPGIPSAVAVISADPAARPVTTPLGDTDATAPSDVDHSKLLPSMTVLPDPRAVAVSRSVCPTARLVWGAVTVTEVTGVGPTSPPPSSPPQPETPVMTISEKAKQSILYLSTGAPFQGVSGQPRGARIYLIMKVIGTGGKRPLVKGSRFVARSGCRSIAGSPGMGERLSLSLLENGVRSAAPPSPAMAIGWIVDRMCA